MDWNRPTVSAYARNFLEKSYLYYSRYTSIDKVKIFCVLRDKVARQQADVLSGEQEIVTKEFLERF